MSYFVFPSIFLAGVCFEVKIVKRVRMWERLFGVDAGVILVLFSWQMHTIITDKQNGSSFWFDNFPLGFSPSPFSRCAAEGRWKWVSRSFSFWRTSEGSSWTERVENGVRYGSAESSKIKIYVRADFGWASSLQFIKCFLSADFCELFTWTLLSQLRTWTIKSSTSMEVLVPEDIIKLSTQGLKMSQSVASGTGTSKTQIEVDDLCKGVLRSPCPILINPFAQMLWLSQHAGDVLTLESPGPINKSVAEVAEVVLRPGVCQKNIPQDAMQAGQDRRRQSPCSRLRTGILDNAQERSII